MSSTKHIAVVVGTRPEAIKMAPVYLALRARPQIRASLIATAQHRQLLDQVFTAFAMTPDVDLNLMQPNQTLAEVSARLLTGVQRTLAELRPGAVLVHGDTATCLFSAIAAFYERIPVGHVEAGLRTYDFAAPWPEEMNRRLVAPISRWCFAPTEGAAANLRAERVPESSIFITGNTVIDALLLARQAARERKFTFTGLPVGALDGHRLILITGHRRESFGQPMEEFCLALRQIADAHADVVMVYPVHLNPNIQRPVHRILGQHPRIFLIPPVEYLPFVRLMDQSYLIITDSGGIQEEAPSFGKPVLVTRTTTERPEAVAAGLAKLVGTCREKIVDETSRLLTDPAAYQAMAHGANPYGDGRSAERIAEILLAQA